MKNVHATLFQLLFTLLATLSASSCKYFRKTGAESKAIVSEDGKFAFTLVPIRNSYTPNPQGELYEDDARKQQNAIRLTYVAIQCESDGVLAAVQLAHLVESEARRSREALRRNGRKLILQLASSQSQMKSCSIIGDYAMGPASWVDVFSKKPTAGEEDLYYAQQMAWLAARGQTNDGAEAFKSFTVAFLDFTSQSMGGVQRGYDEIIAGKLKQADLDFNPCVGDDSTRGFGIFDKKKIFNCYQGHDYQILSGYADKRDVFLQKVSVNEQEFLKDLHALPKSISAPDGFSLTDGWDVALKIDATIANDLKLSGKFSKVSVLAENASLPADSGLRVHPVTKVLTPKWGYFADTFSLTFSSSGPIDAVTYSNAHKVEMPPSIPPAQLDQDLFEARMSKGGMMLGGVRRGWSRGGRRFSFYQPTGNFGQYPVYQNVQYATASNGAVVQSSTGNWTCIGRSPDGNYIWKKSGDNGIYYANAAGTLVTRNIGNGANPTAAPTTANSQSSSNPVPQTDVEKIRARLGWNNVSDQTLRDGAVLPNFSELNGYLPNANVPDAMYSQSSFNCQAFAADATRRIADIAPGVTTGTFAIDGKFNLDGKPIGHSMVWMYAGRNANGQDQYHLYDPLQQVMTKEPVTNATFAQGLASMGLESIYQVDKWKVSVGGVTMPDGTISPGIKTYDPKVGINSVLWDQSTLGVLGKTVVPNGMEAEVALYNPDGSPKYDYLPPSILGINKPVVVPPPAKSPVTPGSQVFGASPSEGFQQTMAAVANGNASAGPSNPGAGTNAGQFSAFATDEAYGGYVGAYGDSTPTNGLMGTTSQILE